MSLKDEISNIIESTEVTGAPITAATIVDRARDAEAYPALNKHLWQVPEADLAAEARLARAHRLLITMHVTIPETGERTRMLVHTVGTPGYQPLDRVTKIPDLAAAKLRQLTDDVARARGRLRAFKAAIPDDLADEIDKALETAESKINDAISAPQLEAAL